MPISEVARTCARSTPKHTPVVRRSRLSPGAFFYIPSGRERYFSHMRAASTARVRTVKM